MMSSDRFEETKWEELTCFVSEKESGEERPWRGKAASMDTTRKGGDASGRRVGAKKTKWSVPSLKLSEKSLEVLGTFCHPSNMHAVR